jgi:two-component system aerobic respiration control sensor histidine kinase ArcB
MNPSISSAMQMNPINNNVIDKPMMEASNIKHPSKPCLLLVEDDVILQTIHRSILEDMGYQVILAINAAEALRLSEYQSYDAILMDVGLPDGDGIEVSSQIRQRNGRGHRIPIIVITAFVGEEIKIRSLKAGINEVLLKPLDCKLLQKALHQFCLI